MVFYMTSARYPPEQITNVLAAACVERIHFYILHRKSKENI